ncbi:MAG: Phosphonate transporter phosphate-binding periplasmic component [bacterium]|nr:Phosphonate transporter phosphate-binding periplasmic component [bacterium]
MVKRQGALRLAVSRSNGGPALLDGARQFATALGQRLGLPVEVSVTYDYATLLKTLVGNGAELAWMPPLIHARAAALGARLVALSQRGGQLGYRSAIVVASERFGSVRDLVGVRAAWVDRASSSGYVFPRLHLLAAGLDPVATFASERFYGSATSACRAVAGGEADVTACFLGAAQDRAAAQGEVERTVKAGAALRVLDVTAMIPADGFVVAPAVDDERCKALRTALTQMHVGVEGAGALQALLQAERLVRAPDDVVRDLRRLVAHASE